MLEVVEVCEVVAEGKVRRRLRGRWGRGDQAGEARRYLSKLRRLTKKS